MNEINPNWNWGPAWNRLCEEMNTMCGDMNTLAWLFEEEKTIQRLYIESAFWALSGTRMTVDEFARELGLGASAIGTADEYERPAEGALDAGSQGQV